MKIKSKDEQQILANNLAFYRKNAKMTQLDLATHFNYSDKAISKWEKGESAPSIFVLRSLAKFYGITVDDFFNEVPKKPIFNKTRKHILITILSMTLVWLVVTVFFVLFTYVFNEIPAFENNDFTWYIWVLGIPICAILGIVFSCLWGNQILTTISISILVWSTILCVYLPLEILTNVSNMGLLFIIGVPLQIMVILWYFLRIKTKRRNQQIVTPSNVINKNQDNENNDDKED